jgi:predicted nucleotidyltransferase
VNIAYNHSRLQKLAASWGIRRLAVFGSCSQERNGSDSDIDLLVEFHPNRKPSLIGHMQLEDSLSELFERDADLSTLESIKNAGSQRRKDSILGQAVEIYCDV